MIGFWAVCKRELKAYFTTPVAYVFLVVFLFFAGYLPFELGDFYIRRQADLSAFFRYLPALLAVLVPCVAMRLWAAERRSGSIELLLTLPITVRHAVLGKFVAAWAFLGIALLLTLPMPLTVAYLGEPDLGPMLCGYAGAFLMAGGFLAVGCFFSALSRSQVISFVLAVVVCGILVYAGMPTTQGFLTGSLGAGVAGVVESFSMQSHFASIQRGVIALGDVIYFLAVICGWLAACWVVLDERRAA
ncbi:MAG: heme exporter protein CcmB [Phycisphaerae bacterium]|nr:heme exporter protein CcmB [Phycisphaerae bacterium]